MGGPGAEELTPVEVDIAIVSRLEASHVEMPSDLLRFVAFQWEIIEAVHGRRARSERRSSIASAMVTIGEAGRNAGHGRRAVHRLRGGIPSGGGEQSAE